MLVFRKGLRTYSPPPPPCANTFSKSKIKALHELCSSDVIIDLQAQEL